MLPGERVLRRRMHRGPSASDGLGATRKTDGDCESDECASDGVTDHCVVGCQTSDDQCPSDFECLDSGSGGGWRGLIAIAAAACVRRRRDRRYSLGGYTTIATTTLPSARSSAGVTVAPLLHATYASELRHSSSSPSASACDPNTACAVQPAE